MSELLDALEKCKQSARHGYNIAKEQTSSLSHTLAAAEDRVQSTLTAFDQSICYDAESSEILRSQLLDIQQSFETLSYTFKDHLEDLHQNLSQFTVAVFGKTKTGKSTLMETLIHGNGDSIGKGAQRTTKDVRTYTWNNLHVIDMPGILAVQGEEDDDIAYNAAKSADLIIFLLSDDNPSSEEAEWLIRVKRLGKPIICLINIKIEVPENPDNKIFLYDLKEAFSEERLSQFRNQFTAFATSLGQDISYIPFIFAHLDLAFKVDKITDPEKKRSLEKLSRIGILQQQIINQVIEKGSFLRKKTFIDDISAPMLDSFENLLYQSEINSQQGRIIQFKKTTLGDWKKRFHEEACSQISSLCIQIKSELISEVAEFAEDHFADNDVNKEWKEFIAQYHIDERCAELLNSLENICNDRIAQVTQSLTNELNFTAKVTSKHFLNTYRIIDAKRVWSWSTKILGGGLSIGAIIALLAGSTLTGPLGWAAIIVSAIGEIGNRLFKSKEMREHEARTKLETQLTNSIESLCKSLEKQMLDNLHLLIRTRIFAIENELYRMKNAIFTLADTQRELAWEINKHLLDLNRQYLIEALNDINKSNLQNLFTRVARIPGDSIIIIMNKNSCFTYKNTMAVQNLISEQLSFVEVNKDKRENIANILGTEIRRDMIRYEEKINIAHIRNLKITDEISTRIRLAQQLTETQIISY